MIIFLLLFTPSWCGLSLQGWAFSQFIESNPLQFKIPAWMLNRQRDVKDGKTSQKYANFLGQSIHEDIERVKRVRLRLGYSSSLGHQRLFSVHWVLEKTGQIDDDSLFEKVGW